MQQNNINLALKVEDCVVYVCDCVCCHCVAFVLPLAEGLRLT